MACLYEENHSSENVKSAGVNGLYKQSLKSEIIYMSAMTRVRELYTVKEDSAADSVDFIFSVFVLMHRGISKRIKDDCYICQVESLHCDRQPVLHVLQAFTQVTRAQELT